MAKVSKSVSFKGAQIDSENMMIVEYGKDYTNEYSLLDVLHEWDGIEGVSLTIKQDSDLSPNLDIKDGDQD